MRSSNDLATEQFGMQDDRDAVLAHRLEALESRVAFQEQTIEELNESLFAQQQRIERLMTQVEWLAGKARDLSERLTDAGSGDEPPPPHY